MATKKKARGKLGSEKSAVKKAAAKKPAAKRKSAAKKSVAKRKPAAKKSVAKRKPAAKKSVAKRKPAAKKSVAKRKPAAKKSVAKRKPAAKKKPAIKKARAAARKTAAKKSPVAKKKATAAATSQVAAAIQATVRIQEPELQELETVQEPDTAQEPETVAAPRADDAELAERVRALWQRLEAWCAAHAGRSLNLAPGATPGAIAAAEQAMGLAFPPDFRASLLLHEGQTTFRDGASPSFPWLPGCPQLAPLSQIVSQHKEIQGLADEYPPPDEVDDEGRVRLGAYRKGRIPIAGTPWWDGDTTYIDLDPGPRGTPGQIITMVTECDFVVLGRSLEDALTRWVAALESGRWTYDRDKRAEHRTGDAPHDGHPSFHFSQA